MNMSKEREDSICASETVSSEQNDSQTRANGQMNKERPDSGVPSSCVSMGSQKSMSLPIAFKDGGNSDQQSQMNHERVDPPVSTNVSMRSERSISVPIEFKEGHDSDQQSFEHTPHYVFWKGSELLSDQHQHQTAGLYSKETQPEIYQRNLKSTLKKKFQCLSEGIAQAGNYTPLNEIYTDLYITEGESRGVNNQHEVRQIEEASWKPSSPETTIRYEDVFKPLPGRKQPVRTMVTKGVAGIGKTVLTQKYTLDWAEGKHNQHIQFIFPFTFRELNLLKKTYSLVELVYHVFGDTNEAGICSFEHFQVVFILDGLDECRLPLDFHNNQILTGVTESTSVDVLLTNLIRGKLLPSARVWITTRPAAAHQIPPECIDMVTEVRGFTNPQKEEYFRKSFTGEEKANQIISHIKTSRSLLIMCHIPVFCWITATVLDHVLKIKEKTELPKTLTEMYINFLLVLTKLGNLKYHGKAEKDPVWNTETKQIFLALGKLAFEQLEKGNLVFYEADLKECGISIKSASVYSGLFTEIFKEEYGLNQERVFCFVHLSIQEFLAALYVFLMFTHTGVDLLRRKMLSLRHEFYQKAVDKALQSPNGHLDLFLRFLLGLSLDTNQRLLQGLLKSTGMKPPVKDMIVQYIKKKIRDCPCPERSINLFHCLNELNDHSLVEEIQEYLRSHVHTGSFENRFTPSQWSALAYILLSSQKDLDMFDLKKFSASMKGLLWLLPVVKASKKSVLTSCNLSSKSCEVLASVLASSNCSLRELDLSDNDLYDSGVKLLSDGLQSPQCRLESLGLSGCLVTDEGCKFLASALNFNPSHLRELDLSFNDLGDSGVTLMSAGVQNPNWKLEFLKIDHCGKARLKPSPFRYSCELTLDPNTADRNLLLSKDNKAVLVVTEKQPYPDHPDRFDSWKQLLCSEGLTGRCYWEVQWKGRVRIGVAYRGIRRKSDSTDCCIGWNDQSWSLFCSPQSFTAWHNNTALDIDTLPPTDYSRVAVYLDCPAGTVSFYCLPSIVSSRKRIHLHTFHSTFTEPLYAAFGFGRVLELEYGTTLLTSSATLCEIND